MRQFDPHDKRDKARIELTCRVDIVQRGYICGSRF